jgi:hypothetical protein
MSLSVQASVWGLHIIRISIGHTRLILLHLKFYTLVIFGLRPMLHSLICFLAWINNIWQKLRTLVVIYLSMIHLWCFFELLATCVDFIYFCSTCFWYFVRFLDFHFTIIKLGLCFIMCWVPFLPLMHLDEVRFLFFNKSCLFSGRFSIYRPCHNIRITLVVVLITLLLKRFWVLLRSYLIPPDASRRLGRIRILEIRVRLWICIFRRLLLTDYLW